MSVAQDVDGHALPAEFVDHAQRVRVEVLDRDVEQNSLDPVPTEVLHVELGPLQRELHRGAPLAIARMPGVHERVAQRLRGFTIADHPAVEPWPQDVQDRRSHDTLARFPFA